MDIMNRKIEEKITEQITECKNINPIIYYDILNKVINIILKKEDENLIEQYEKELNKIDNNYKIQIYDSLFKRYLYMYIFVKNKLIICKNLLDKVYPEELKKIYEYYESPEKFKLPQTGNDNDYLLTIVFDYTYIYVKNIISKKVDEIYEQVIDVERNKKCNETFNGNVKHFKMLSLILLNNYFTDTYKYTIFKIYNHEIHNLKNNLVENLKNFFNSDTDLRRYNDEQLYNICSDDFIYESVNEKNTVEYDIIECQNKGRKYFLQDMEKYSDFKVEENFIYDISKLDIIKYEKYISLLIGEDPYGFGAHSMLLISEYINDEYNIFLFFPNGLYDHIRYGDDLHKMKLRLKKIDKKVNFTYSTLIKDQSLLDNITIYFSEHTKEIDTNFGYFTNFQDIVYKYDMRHRRIKQHFGTCFMWCVLFVEVFLKLKKLHDVTPLNVYRYLVKKYNNPVKITDLIESYVVYFSNDKIELDKKNKMLDKKGYKHCKKLTNDEYIEQYKKYIIPSKYSPNYERLLEEKLKTAAKDYFLLPYAEAKLNARVLKNDVIEKNLIKYEQIISSKYNAFFIKHINNKTFFNTSTQLVTEALFNNDILLNSDILEKKMIIQLNTNSICILTDIKGIKYLFLINLSFETNEQEELIKLLDKKNIKYNLVYINKGTKYIFEHTDIHLIRYIVIDLFLKYINLYDEFEQIIVKVYKNKHYIIDSFCLYIDMI